MDLPWLIINLRTSIAERPARKQPECAVKNEARSEGENDFEERPSQAS